jgi:hypothetical protein
MTRFLTTRRNIFALGSACRNYAVPFTRTRLRNWCGIQRGVRGAVPDEPALGLTSVINF